MPGTPYSWHRQEPSGSLPELFAQMEWDEGSSEWDQEADLRRVVKYVRGSKHLKLPEEWRNVLPVSI